ncbi:MAG: hypothetical protein LCI03_08520 [Actinobacteria bacterium]|jgi:hypothetical protein|nr:hypothetical protein [Actinomycetota bacterium]
MTATAADVATSRARSGRGLFAAAVAMALLAALGAYMLWAEGRSLSFGWFANTPPSSAEPAFDLAPTSAWAAVPVALVVLACVLLLRSAWIAAAQARQPDGPGGRAAWRYIALTLVVVIGSMLVTAAFTVWVDGSVVWTALTGPEVVVSPWEPPAIEILDRILLTIDAFGGLQVLAWFGVAALVSAIWVALAARNSSPLLPPGQQEG